MRGYSNKMANILNLYFLFTVCSNLDLNKFTESFNKPLGINYITSQFWWLYLLTCLLTVTLCSMGGHKYRVSKRCNRATVRSRKIFQILRNILVFERKNEQFIKFLPFLGIFCIKKKMFWTILFAQNFWAEIVGAQTNLLLESPILHPL